MRLLDPKEAHANADDPRWQPLRVVAHMAEPIQMYEGIHLDGPLAWGAYQLYLDAGSPDGELDSRALHLSPWAHDFTLPLARWSAPLPAGDQVDLRLLTPAGQIWGWCCSINVADWLLHGSEPMRKMPAVDEMKILTDSPSFHPGLGTMKASDIKLPTRTAHTLTWYALGDAEAVAACLSRVYALGKNVNSGNGWLLTDEDGAPRWDVDVLTGEDARTFWLRKDGALMRTMPASFDASRPSRRGKIRTPYHHHSRVIRCVEADHD